MPIIILCAWFREIKSSDIESKFNILKHGEDKTGILLLFGLEYQYLLI